VGHDTGGSSLPPSNLTNSNGIVAWIEDSSVYYSVYDPSDGNWKVGHDTGGSSLTPYNLTNSHGVVAWIENSSVFYSTYDPIAENWKVAHTNPNGTPMNISTTNGTVSFWVETQYYTRGYDYISGNWTDVPTQPLSFYVASSIWAANNDYWVHFNDMSLGASSYYWNFGDGGGSAEPDPIHVYTQPGVFPVTLDVYGPGGFDSSTQYIITDFEAPTGSIVINNGDAETYSTSVTLSLSAADNSGTVDSMRFSNDNSTWSSWEQYAVTKSWTLTPGTGTKYVYAQFRDAAQNTSSTYSDNIALVPPPSITVTYPNGGEDIEVNTTCTITWTATTITGSVNIDLYKGGILSQNLGTTAAADQSFPWSIPTGFTTGSDYQIRIHQDNIEDFSDNNFTITMVQHPETQPDFNNDGHTDLVWRNTSNGDNIVWYLTNVSLNGFGNLQDESDLNWHIKGTGDFNYDGHIDILWQHASTGQSRIWYLNNVTVTGTANLPPISDTNWLITGTGDFNSDDKVDILWRNMSTGENLTWYLDGTVILGFGHIPTSINFDWKVVGTGDFNSDGYVDILWRHSVSGQNLIWYMSNVTLNGFGSLPDEINLDLEIGAVGDFNSDSYVDIVWRNTSNGQNTVWYLNNTTLLGTGTLPSTANTDWTIVN
jgi:hypothetical protein